MNKFNIDDTVKQIINSCINSETNEVEIILPDTSCGKEVFLKISDETKNYGQLYNWSYTIYDNGRMGERTIVNNTTIRKHKLIKTN